MLYLQKEFFGPNLESFLLCCFKVFLLANISHESIGFIALLDKPGKNTGSVLSNPGVKHTDQIQIPIYIPKPPEYARRTRPLLADMAMEVDRVRKAVMGSKLQFSAMRIDRPMAFLPS